LLEGRCAFEAARNATRCRPGGAGSPARQAQQACPARRINDYYDANFAIHEAIITLANNRWLAQVITDLRKIVKLARLQQLHAPGRLEQSLSEHMAVFAALKARDAKAPKRPCAPTSRASASAARVARNQKSRLA
jgi:DNA-binding GntR family transcriptional regulator